MERPKFKCLDHLDLKVRDLEKSLDFYVGLLGWRVTDGKNSSGFFNKPNRFVTCTDKHHTINIFEFRPKDGSCDPPVGHTHDNDQYGVMHIAFEVEDKEAFFAWEIYLRSKGVEFVYGPLLHSVNHPEGDNRSFGENRALYFTDPDGNVIEICCDMMRIAEDGEVDREWHAERIRRDGYDPNDVPVSRIPEIIRYETSCWT